MCAGAVVLAPGVARATAYSVTSPADFPDVNPGNNVCETAAGNAVCTLRAAIQESNAHAGADSITLQANVTYQLTRVGSDDTALNGDLDILDSVSITAAGPNTIIDGNGTVTLDRVFDIFRCLGNVVGGVGECTNGTVTASISGITIQRGRPPSGGGGIRNGAILALANCTVTDNRVAGFDIHGGGILSFGPLTIDNCTISNNLTSSAGNGGGIYGNGRVVGSTISANAAGRGGGIYGSGMVVGSTISGNRADTGGGMNVLGSVAIVNSTISGNFSFGNGAGIFNGGGMFGFSSTTALFNTTVTLNLANADSSGTAAGGGISNAGGSTLTLANSIVSSNENELPGIPFPTLLLDDCAGTITSQGNNIINNVDTNHCTVTGTYFITNVDLGPLQDNGGPTFTHALGNASNAIDTGNFGGCTDNIGAVLTTDQRGSPRPQGVRCDIGAFEASDSLFGDGFES